MAKTLYVVATPIGNIQDLSPRAQAILNEVAVIAAEDTRHSLPLLKQLGIQTHVVSYHQHNEKERTVQLIERLKQGDDVALISDAGSPLVSDPGSVLVRLSHQNAITVVAIPGPSAVIAALSISGMNADNGFLFAGFLPAKGSKRKTALEAFCYETRPVVLYESVHRILDLLELVVTVFGEGREIAVARELTKRYECIHVKEAKALLDHFKGAPNEVKGEFVVIISADHTEKQAVSTIDEARLLTALLEEMPLKQAVSIAQRATGGRHKVLYDLALKLR